MYVGITFLGGYFGKINLNLKCIYSLTQILLLVIYLTDKFKCVLRYMYKDVR